MPGCGASPSPSIPLARADIRRIGLPEEPYLASRQGRGGFATSVESVGSACIRCDGHRWPLYDGVAVAEEVCALQGASAPFVFTRSVSLSSRSSAMLVRVKAASLLIHGRRDRARRLAVTARAVREVRSARPLCGVIVALTRSTADCHFSHPPGRAMKSKNKTMTFGADGQPTSSSLGPAATEAQMSERLKKFAAPTNGEAERIIPASSAATTPAVEAGGDAVMA